MSESGNMMKYDANKKSKGTAYLLCIFLGTLGAHRFYMDKNGTAAIILTNTILSAFLMFVFIGFFTAMISTIWVFIDLFRVPGFIEEYNNNLALSLEGKNIEENPKIV